MDLREWARLYREWDYKRREERLRQAGRSSVGEKLADFFDLCEAVRQLAPHKSEALRQRELESHIQLQRRILEFEKLRRRGNLNR